MKLTIALSAIALACVGTVNAYSANLDGLYGLVCATHAQAEATSASGATGTDLFTDTSIFQVITGYALGTQVEQNVTESTCFIQAAQTKAFMDTITDSVYTIGVEVYTFSFANIGTQASTLLISLNNLLIQLSDQATACQDNLKIKQFASRTQTASGVSNLVFTLVYGIGYNFLAEYVTFLPAGNQQTLNIASLNIFNMGYSYFTTFAPIDCQALGFNFGLFVSELLEAKTDTTVAFVEVQTFA